MLALAGAQKFLPNSLNVLNYERNIVLKWKYYKVEYDKKNMLVVCEKSHHLKIKKNIMIKSINWVLKNFFRTS